MTSKSENSTPKSPPNHPHFKPGSRIEISPEEDGFRGSWYEGKIIRRSSSKTRVKYWVQYDKLFEDESGTKPLKEHLDFVQLRPAAPREKKRKFRFGDKVDAYHNDGWWEGSITKEREDGRFAVFFRGTREEMVFEDEDLRVHREWVDEKWEPPLEEVEEDTVTEDGEEEKESLQEKQVDNKIAKPLIATDVRPDDEVVVVEEEFPKGMLVEVSSDEEGFEGAWFAATVVEPVGKDKYLIEYKHLKTEDDSDFLREEVDTMHLRPFPPETLAIDRFKFLDEVDALYNDGWWTGVVSKVHVDDKYVVYFRGTGEETVFRHHELRPHQDWIGGQWITPSSAPKL